MCGGAAEEHRGDGEARRGRSRRDRPPPRRDRRRLDDDEVVAGVVESDARPEAHLPEEAHRGVEGRRGAARTAPPRRAGAQPAMEVDVVRDAPARGEDRGVHRRGAGSGEGAHVVRHRAPEELQASSPATRSTRREASEAPAASIADAPNEMETDPGAEEVNTSNSYVGIPSAGGGAAMTSHEMNCGD